MVSESRRKGLCVHVLLCSNKYGALNNCNNYSLKISHLIPINQSEYSLSSFPPEGG